MFYKKQISVLIVMLMILPMLYGCAAIVAGGAAAGATYIYSEGWVEKNYKSDLNGSVAAGEKALKSLGMVIVEKSVKVSSAQFKATKGGEDYWIKMKENASKQTNISVRAGLLGDKDASYKIHDRIRMNL